MTDYCNYLALSWAKSVQQNARNGNWLYNV